MPVFSHLEDLAKLGKPLVVALGVFDGVHVGHRAVVESACRLALECGAVPVAMYFEPHPRKVLGLGSPLELCTLAERIERLRRLGIRHFVQYPFTREVASWSPEEFFRKCFIDSGVEVKGFCVGSGWRFGCRNGGTTETLRQLGAGIGAEVLAVPHVELLGGVVSSSRIRELLERGAVEDAARLLERWYSLSGEVEHGDGRGGPVLAYPTANLAASERQLPRFGVYAASVRMGHRCQKAIVYVGNAPTLRGKDGLVVVEVHLLNYSGELYGKTIRVEFRSYLRESIAFPSAEALKAQIAKDILRAEKLLK